MIANCPYFELRENGPGDLHAALPDERRITVLCADGDTSEFVGNHLFDESYAVDHRAHGMKAILGRRALDGRNAFELELSPNNCAATTTGRQTTKTEAQGQSGRLFYAPLAPGSDPSIRLNRSRTSAAMSSSSVLSTAPSRTSGSTALTATTPSSVS